MAIGIQPSMELPSRISALTGTSKIALLGAGRLGEALLSGLLASETVSSNQLVATAAHRSRIDDVSKRLGICTTLRNLEAIESADVILLGLKPQTVGPVLQEIGDAVNEDQLIISTAASVSTAYMENLLRKSVPVVRAMPNTPCLLRRGMTAISAGRYAHNGHLELAQKIFSCLGRTILIDEKHMDAVTGLSASGPAYIYIVIESLAEGGVKMGLPREIATELAAQTVLGAGTMVLETGEHPARLKDLVTTPAGCTIDGILELEEGGLRVTLIKAVVRATQRAKELLHG
jgi:pyrroline-5-carboxylate reductase